MAVPVQPPPAMARCSSLASEFCKNHALSLPGRISARLHWTMALQFLHGMSRLLLTPSTRSLRSTIVVCSKQAQWSQSAGLLRFLADINSFNAVMHAQGKCDLWQQAETTLGGLRPKRVKPDLITLNTLIAAFARQDWTRAMRTLSTCLQGKASGDVVTFSTAISACGEAACWQAALTLFYRHVAQSAVACSAVIKSFRPLGQWLRALVAGKSFLRHNRVVTNACIGTCQRRGLWQESLILLGGITEPGPVSCTAALSACEAAYKWEVGLQLLYGMHKGRILPDVGCVNAAMSGAVTSSRWEVAERCHEWMMGTILVPDSRSEAVRMNSAAQSGQWAHALRMLMWRNHPAGQVMYNSALCACEKGGCWRHCLQLARAVQAFRLELEDCGCNSVMAGCAVSRPWLWDGLIRTVLSLSYCFDFFYFAY